MQQFASRIKRLLAVGFAAMLMITASVFASPLSASAAQTGKVSANTLYLRREASLASERIDTMYKGDFVTILSEEDGWYRVDYEGLKGYCTAQYITVGEAQGYAANADSKYIQSGDTGTKVSNVQQCLVDHGYLTSAPDGIYGPKTEAAVRKFQADKGIEVDGVVGPESLKLLEQSPKATSGGNASSDGLLRIGSRGQAVVEVQTKLKNKGYAIGSSDGVFGAKTAQGILSFQRDYGLEEDGVVGSETLKALSSGTAKKTTTETPKKDTSTDNKDTSSGDKKADTKSEDTPKAGGDTSKENVQMMAWFGGVENIFKRGDVATITDVRTGISWQERRMGGSYHADCEPLTAEDTAKMKQVYGGTWSWDRRPVIVEVNGYRFAASINGMPHMGWTIKGNNFDGHHCIHFKNSRVHATNAKCPKHQAAVQEAYNWANK